MMLGEHTVLRSQKLVPVHACLGCGKASRRSDSDGVPNPSGIFKCSACGYEGRLNIEIREVEESG